MAAPEPLARSGPIAVCGSAAYDVLMAYEGRFRDHLHPDHLDRLYLNFRVGRPWRAPGGCGANIAYTLGLLGARPLLCSQVGEDGGELLAALGAAGVDIGGVTVEPGATATGFMVRDAAANHIIAFHDGDPDPQRARGLADLVPRPGLVVVSTSAPALFLRRLEECRALALPYLLDPAKSALDVAPEELRAALLGARAVVANGYEMAVLSERAGESPDRLAERGILVAITRGEQGAELRWARERAAVAAVPPRQPVDPSGAGDAFTAGLAWACWHGLPLAVAGRVAALCATWALEAPGAQGHRFTPESFSARYHAAYGEAPPAPLPSAG